MSSAAPQSLPQSLAAAELNLRGVEIQGLEGLDHNSTGSLGIVYLTLPCCDGALNVVIAATCEHGEFGPTADVQVGSVSHVDFWGRELPLSRQLRAAIVAWCESDRGFAEEIAKEWANAQHEEALANRVAG